MLKQIITKQSLHFRSTFESLFNSDSEKADPNGEEEMAMLGEVYQNSLVKAL